MDNEKRLKINHLLIVFLVAQIIFIIILVAFFNSVNQDDKIVSHNNQPKISINHLDSNEINLTDEAISDIEHSLTETVKLNSPNFNTTDLKANVRNNSFKVATFDRHNFQALSAIVDIPDLEQSYQIFYKYPIQNNSGFPASQNPRAVLCLDSKTEIIYTNFQCKDQYTDPVRPMIVKDYLPYFYFDYFSAYINSNNPQTIIISPSVTYDNDDATKSHYIEEVKNAIDSLGISPDYFEYYVQTAEDVNHYNPSR